MGRPPLCDDLVRLIFVPGFAYDVLKDKGGKNRSKYIRGLIERAAMPSHEYQKVWQRIVQIGRRLVVLGRIREIDRIPQVLTDDNQFEGFMKRETVIKSLNEMLAMGKRLEEISHVLPAVSPYAISRKKIAEMMKQEVRGGKTGSMCIRMPKSDHDKLKMISKSSGLSMSAVLRAWILDLKLPDKSLQLAGGELLRTSWLIRHIAGDWRRVMGDIPFLNDLVGRADALYRSGQRIATYTVKVITYDTMSRSIEAQLEAA